MISESSAIGPFFMMSMLIGAAMLVIADEFSNMSSLRSVRSTSP
jgi:hypothetical protein